MFPIAQEIVNSYSAARPSIKISLSMSGTTSGFLKFCNGKLDINNASRPMADDEAETCQRNGVDFLELKIANDAVVIAVHPANDWCQSLTLNELRFMWLKNDLEDNIYWSDVRPEWPKEPITFFAPGLMSGTQDVFLKSLYDTSASKVRAVHTSEDHNDVVMSISRDTFAIGYFSLPYMHSNEILARPVAIDDQDSTNGSGAIMPSVQAIEELSYFPFQRPLYLYVNRRVLADAEYADFLRYFLKEAPIQSKALGYAPLSKMDLNEELNKLETAIAALAVKK